MALASAIASSSSANEMTGRDRAEDLLALHERVGGHAGEHGRLVEVAGAVARLAADEHLGALADGVLDELCARRRALAWSISGPIVTASSVPRPSTSPRIRSASRSREVRGDRLVDEEAVGARARLADVAHLREHRALDGDVEVGVLEDEERRVAAELHRHPQQLLGGLLDEHLADLRSSR